MPKQRKNASGSKKKEVEQAIDQDPRFADIKNDPRFRSIKKEKVKGEVDERFKKSFGTDRKQSKKREEDSEDDLLAQLDELNRRARGETSDMESSSESEVEDEVLLQQEPEEEEEEEEIEDGEATRRLACVNLNWDIISAVDLLSVFKSFSQGGSVYSVTIYPSEFGKKRLEEEEKYGPEGRIVEDNESFDEEDIEQEEKVDEARLRKYERERRRYYFAVIECDNKFTANSLYELTDGTEFMRTGSILDLRFIPDDMVFDSSSIKDKATFVPESYAPSVTNFNDVSSHSNVQLSWDGEDKKRTNELVKGRASKKNDRGEIDYSNYLASSDSDEEDGEDVRQKYASFLKGTEEDEEEEEEEKDADITFIPGLKSTLNKTLEEKAKEEKAKESMSVYEEYRRKMKEKRKQKTQQEEDEMGVDGAEEEDLFADLDAENRRNRKGKKGKKGKKEKPEDAKKRAELELLMIDEGDELKHNFDMKEIRKDAENQGKKNKKRSKNEVKDDFEINTEDPRFRSLVTNSDYSIDVTNPMFVKTKNMAKLVDSVTKKRKKE